MIEFTSAMQKQYATGQEHRFGSFYKPLKSLVDVYRRMTGDYRTEEQLKIACSCEPPVYFLLRGCMIPHAYGITLSVEELGADCRILQNSTMGTNARNMVAGEKTKDKPRIGHLVSIGAGSVLSGPVRIGNNVIVAANAFVDKDVPDNSVVYGINQLKPLKDYHWDYLKLQLWYCVNEYNLVPGLCYHYGKLMIDLDYVEERQRLVEDMLK